MYSNSLNRLVLFWEITGNQKKNPHKSFRFMWARSLVIIINHFAWLTSEELFYGFLASDILLKVHRIIRPNNNWHYTVYNTEVAFPCLKCKMYDVIKWCLQEHEKNMAVRLCCIYALSKFYSLNSTNK